MHLFPKMQEMAIQHFRRFAESDRTFRASDTPAFPSVSAIGLVSYVIMVDWGESTIINFKDDNGKDFLFLLVQNEKLGKTRRSQ